MNKGERISRSVAGLAGEGADLGSENVQTPFYRRFSSAGTNNYYESA